MHKKSIQLIKSNCLQAPHRSPLHTRRRFPLLNQMHCYQQQQSNHDPNQQNPKLQQHQRILQNLLKHLRFS